MIPGEGCHLLRVGRRVFLTDGLIDEPVKVLWVDSGCWKQTLIFF